MPADVFPSTTVMSDHLRGEERIPWTDGSPGRRGARAFWFDATGLPAMVRPLRLGACGRSHIGVNTFCFTPSCPFPPFWFGLRVWLWEGPTNCLFGHFVNRNHVCDDFCDTSLREPALNIVVVWWFHKVLLGSRKCIGACGNTATPGHGPARASTESRKAQTNQ